jgi:YHS domain-containing protein
VTGRLPARHPRPTRRPSASRRRALLAVAAGGVLALGGCGPLVTQSPDGALRPVNAQPGENGARVILGGHDVVAYFTEGRHRPGDPRFASVHEGVTFRFASADHKARFDANPAGFIPQYGGYCANGIVYAIPWGGDADAWRIIDGKLYIFGGGASRAAFELDVPGNLKLADAYWNDEVAGSNALVQRTRRLLFKVPHYRTGEELAQAVAARGATGR